MYLCADTSLIMACSLTDGLALRSEIKGRGQRREKRERMTGLSSAPRGAVSQSCLNRSYSCERGGRSLGISIAANGRSALLSGRVRHSVDCRCCSCLFVLFSCLHAAAERDK